MFVNAKQIGCCSFDLLTTTYEYVAVYDGGSIGARGKEWPEKLKTSRDIGCLVG